MKYHVSRGDQVYGPYTLAELQRYMAAGNIVGSDLARGEGTDEWVRADRLVANIGAPTNVPSPPGYGAPGYGQELTTAGAAAFADAGRPLPPGLHWALVLLLSIVTCGVFSLIWMFVEAFYASRLGPGCRAPLFYGLHVGGFIAGQFLVVSGDTSMIATGCLLWIAALVFVVAGHYSINEALQKHLGLRLSGIMVMLFNIVYFQYHLSAVRGRMLQARGATRWD